MTTIHRLLVEDIEHVEPDDTAYGATPGYVRVHFRCACTSLIGSADSDSMIEALEIAAQRVETHESLHRSVTL